MFGSPVEKLVVHRVRTAFGFAVPSILRDGDLVAARSLADRHRVLPAFDRGSDRSIGSTVSSDVMTNIQMQVELRAISQAMSAAEIDFLLFKGLSLFQRCYGKILRPCADIDILVHPWAHDRTVEVLNEIGVTGSKGALRTSTGLEIDLHTSAVEPYVAECPDVSEMFSRRRWDPALEAYTLNDSDHLFVLLMHGFKHDWCKLVWILDVALMVRAADEADLDRLDILARRFEARKRIRIGLAIAHRYFPQPRTLHASVQADDEINVLIQRYQSRLFQIIPNSYLERCAGVFRRRVAYDRPGQWLRYVRARSVNALLRATQRRQLIATL